MTISLLTAGTTVPSQTASQLLPITVPLSPVNQTLATTTITLTPDSPTNNRVLLDSTIGVAAQLNVPQVVVRIFRNSVLIFSSQQGLQNAAEQFYTIRAVTADFNLVPGTYTYTLTIERLAAGTPAAVQGPITLSALAFGPIL
ncbi:exosporium protein C [Paenibacillus sp. JX-17]|uniref:Exosporium protein C n=1 Tax=Paenibacillus lacisoli TaxID=3064525 RepID=A0ABT9CBL4_9BACL|nr:exosporium protein C [Paenibacillus sp. JX-17]MDO7905382.1 exosporium protein C [Paenibacillus sp. JX-17]